MQAANPPTPKVTLLGPSGVGKTNLVRSLIGAAIPTTYIPTLGVEVHAVSLNGRNYNVWDCAGWDSIYRGLGEDAYSIAADYLVFMGVQANDPHIAHLLSVAPGAQVVILPAGATPADLP